MKTIRELRQSGLSLGEAISQYIQQFKVGDKLTGMGCNQRCLRKRLCGKKWMRKILKGKQNLKVACDGL